MKCQTCEYENENFNQFCASCGATLSSAEVSRIKRALKIWWVGGLVGLGTSVSFISVQRALSTDLMFNLWEFGVALLTPALIAVVVARATKAKIHILLAIAYLTLMIPVLGPAVGGTGAEPVWEFAALGLVGGLVWSIPFALSNLLKRRK